MMDARKYDVIVENRRVDWQVTIFEGSKKVAEGFSFRLSYALQEAFDKLKLDFDVSEDGE